MVYVQKAFLEGTFMRTPSFLVCAGLPPDLCARAQLRGNIADAKLYVGRVKHQNE